MKKLFFAALVFAVIAVIIAACSDNNSDTTGAIDYRKAAEREYKKLLDAWFYQGDEHTLMWGNDISELNNYTYCGHRVLLEKKKHPWQDSGYVLSYFGKSLREAQKRYLQYIESGIEQGRRPELVGGGLIRSLGGWQAVKDARFSGQGRIKGDHRILGDSAFVMEAGRDRREI